MKIYFTASVTGSKLYKDNYLGITNVLKELGHQVEDEFVDYTGSQSRDEDDLDQRQKIHSKIMNYINTSDIVIAETSYSSTNVGYEISTALEKEKPVLILHVAGKAPMLLLGKESDKVQVVEYSLDNLKKVLNMAINDLKDQMDVRFNFFVSPKIVNYLDWIAKKRKMPRAVYLRRLIEKDMDKNKEFDKQD